MDGNIHILLNNCLGCGICSDVCQSHALVQSKDLPTPEYYVDLCDFCLECFKQCPFGAIETVLHSTQNTVVIEKL